MALTIKNRVPTKPGRIKLTDENGASAYYTLERADEPTEEGTAINKALLDNMCKAENTLVSSNVQTLVGADNVDDALKFIGGFYNRKIHGASYEDITISDGENNIIVTTDAKGVAIATLMNGTYALSGSISGQSFTETVTDETTDVYCMPKGALYWCGLECDVTGGWSASDYTYRANDASYTVSSGDKNTNDFRLSGTGSYAINLLGTNNLLNLATFNKLYVDCIATTDSYATLNVWIASRKITFGSYAVSNNAYKHTSRQIVEIDISNIESAYYIVISIMGYQSRIGTVYKVWLE